MAENLLFWFVQLPGWALFLYLAYAQCPAAIRYEWGVRMGTQEPETQITPVGRAFWWGLALADLVFYTPLLGLGLAGQALGAGWAVPVLAAALGVTVYWPIASLATVAAARGAPGWSLPKERDYWIVLPIMTGWAVLALLGLVLLA
ncbi:hypothetical protein [Aliiruegeria sabulilitoris]|uniref:hypothetical protein n=1 Tax=Aliiruegeria sabulilitoris TaxID=1510458 RepID=UPI00082FA8FA|nr:hypothetical protein [Aliiruegeria sabulilitoris]NDR54997.1 hypothetical protein [Pseudoruegeria sp. M32A2M]